mmetsp:Transcript_141614/g.394792  ORF Transcript_141614/g.394792 Transcript_141614/m.394792 type:complete len:614 (+) Transcript_141614:27-1868(+)
MLFWRFAVSLLVALLPGSWSQLRAHHRRAPKRSCRAGCCLAVRVLQRHGRPSFQQGGGAEAKGALQQDPSQQYDEVTVEYRACEPAATLALRLPERQQCDGDNSKCTGYVFRQTTDGGCFLRKSRSQVLPDATHVKAVDLVSSGRLTGCSVDNTRGDGTDSSPTPKRSTAILSFQAPHARSQRQPSWEFFTILVQNPPRTPTGKDVLGNVANAFQLVLKSNNGTVLGSAAYAAKEIRSAWFCSYTGWVRTSPCTAKCGGGLRYSVRKLLHPPPKGYDPALLVNCDQGTRKSEPCNEMECAVDCKLGDWVGWADGPCTASCGGGVEVQRRRVIEAASGGGKPCAHWSHASRVRYRPCNPDACPLRCEELSQQHLGNRSGLVVPLLGACSEPCGGGMRPALVPAARKDPGSPEATCAHHSFDVCNVAECKAFNLLPGRPDLPPRVGQWFDLQVVFFLSDLASTLELRAPPGFELGQGKCLLVEHNMPRLRSCKVMKVSSGKQMAVFDFRNPLEPHRFERGDTKYKVRLWVKNPKDCPQGVDPEGVCLGERAWTLTARSHLPAALWESVSASYEVLQAGASVYRRGKAAELDGDKVSLASLPGGAFRKWSPREPLQ